MAAVNVHPRLICTICRDVLTSPKMLPKCHHTFCLTCLEGLAQASGGSSFKCPTCRRRTKVPPYGVKAFQANFFMDDKELELARRGVDSSMCPVHPSKPLDFFCVRCDQTICVSCKLTKHESHPTEDLSDAASRCKTDLAGSRGRLDDKIRHLKNKLREAEDNSKAIQQKETYITEQVQRRHDELVAKAAEYREIVMGTVTRLTKTSLDSAKNDRKCIEKKLDSLLQLQRQVDNALRDSLEPDIVNVEREMRLGLGSAAELAKIDESLPATTSRLVLRSSSDRISGDDIYHFIGHPVHLDVIVNSAPVETVTPFFQCVEKGLNLAVHSVGVMADRNVFVCCGGFPSDYTGVTAVCIDQNGAKCRSVTLNSLCTFRDIGGKQPLFLGHQMVKCEKESIPCCHSKSSRFQLKQTKPLVSTIGQTKVVSVTPVIKLQYEGEILTKTTGKPRAFDASSTGELFAVVQESYDRQGDPQLSTSQEGKQTAGREVCLFDKRNRNALAKYKPPEPNSSFFPTDVCFWKTREEEEKLVVADGQNDAIHVINVSVHGDCTFERYVAAGSCHLVNPTALNTDAQGNLWIGCGNGWVLRCTTHSSTPSSSLTTDEAEHDYDMDSTDESASDSNSEHENDDH